MHEGMNSRIIEFPAVVKGRIEDGRRIVDVEASVEMEDEEGDLILQKALLDSSGSFLRNGHLDIDHVSELGAEMRIPNPLSWIIGRPIEVRDGGNGRTIVRGEIKKALDGRSNPDRNKYDEFWESLMSDPPTPWRASVFGYMGEDTIDCRDEVCAGGPKRFLVKTFDWRSLAFTRNPVNQNIKGYAKIVTAKSWVGRQKIGGWVEEPVSPSGLREMIGQTDCATCGGLRDNPSMPMLTRHYSKCCGMAEDMAEIMAAATMYKGLQEKAFWPVQSGNTSPPLNQHGGLGDWNPNRW